METVILRESHIPGHWNTQGITHNWTLEYPGNYTYLDTGILRESSWTLEFSGNHTYMDTGILRESNIPGHWNTQGITHT